MTSGTDAPITATTAGATPTVAMRLIQATISVINLFDLETLPIVKILEGANASYADLFAEFGGVNGLIDAAHLSEVTSRSRESIEFIAEAFKTALTYEEILQQMSHLTSAVRGPEFKRNRVMRAVVIGSTMHRPELAEALADAQNTLTNRFAEILAEGERRGLYRCVTSPRALASFIQAFTAGQILDEIDHVHTSNDEWLVVVDRSLRALFLPPSTQGDP